LNIEGTVFIRVFAPGSGAGNDLLNARNSIEEDGGRGRV